MAISDRQMAVIKPSLSFCDFKINFILKLKRGTLPFSIFFYPFFCISTISWSNFNRLLGGLSKIICVLAGS